MVIRNLFAERFGENDYRDERVIDYVYPKKVLLSEFAKEPQILLSPDSAQATLERGNTCILKKGGFILLDFGFEMQGGIQIVTNIWEHNGNNTARARVRFGESAMECMADAAPDLRGKKNATNDHAVRDDIHLLSWLGMTVIGNTGFRFVRIDLLDDIELPIKCVRAKFQYRDLDYLGTFECDDERLNDIWKTAAYTVQLNMQEYVWDGVKRDRLVWIGDMHPETSTVQYIFGDCDCVREYWGAMLDLGATTFWEDFDINWAKNCSKLDEILPEDSQKTDIHGDFGGYCYEGYRHSLCHGWASGPAPFLMEYVLGVKPLEEGCKKVLISPSLGNLEYAKGTVPTPYGLIKISLKRETDGSVKTEFSAPAEIEVILG